MKDTDIIAQLADIQPPPAPESGTWIAVIVTALAVTVALIYLYRYRLRDRPAQPVSQNVCLAALERLEQLEQEWLAGQVDDRQTAFLIATLLRLGLDQAQWPGPVDTTIEDRAFSETLSKIRYEPSPDAALKQDVFVSARCCLLHGPTGC